MESEGRNLHISSKNTCSSRPVKALTVSSILPRASGREMAAFQAVYGVMDRCCQDLLVRLEN